MITTVSCQNFVEKEHVFTEQMCILSELATYKHAADAMPEQMEEVVGTVAAQKLFSLHAAQSEGFHGDKHQSLSIDDQAFLQAWQAQPGFQVLQKECANTVDRLSTAVKKAVMTKVVEQKGRVLEVVLKEPWRPRGDDGSTKTLAELQKMAEPFLTTKLAKQHTQAFKLLLKENFMQPAATSKKEDSEKLPEDKVLASCVLCFCRLTGSQKKNTPFGKVILLISRVKIFVRVGQEWCLPFS